MRYADTLLSQGEVVILRARQHWLALILEARAALVLGLLGIALLAIVVVANLQGQAAQLVSIAALISLGIGLLLFAYRWWDWWAQDYMITNRRLMKVTGILNKRSSDSSLEKINDAVLDQNVLGRLLNYGDLDILTASGESAVDYFRMLKGAKEFKRVMLNQKHALEMEYMYDRPPSPPLRARPMDMNGERTPGALAAAPAAAAPAAAGAPPAAEPRRAGDQREESLGVTQTLARLADLRDRGAIDPEEYEQKKDELLRRL
ncbi:MAG TPA: PH domain-containing protein [Candidatus Caenarcaniphilales bacterium]|nr:PH domain-containing protein [Candidatus Caenarcaniphilales bacterium]